MNAPVRTVVVLLDGVEVQPPEGTQVVPILVSDELHAEAFEPGAALSGCGAKAQFEELDSGFATVTLTHGTKDAH